MKMIYISGDDYASLVFEQTHKSENVLEFIQNYFDEGETDIEYTFSDQNNDEMTVDIQLFQFQEIDPLFVEFVMTNILDYDDSKHHNFYFEGDKF